MWNGLVQLTEEGGNFEALSINRPLYHHSFLTGWLPASDQGGKSIEQ
jgi:hypothetical protein